MILHKLMYTKVFSFLIKLEMASADLFIFLVSTFLSDFEVFSNKRNDCLAQDSNPGPLACEASVLPFCYGYFL